METRQEELKGLSVLLSAKTDKELEELYNNCRLSEMHKDVSDNFTSMLNSFKRATTDKVGYPVLYRYVSMEITKRWKRQNQTLKDFKNLFN